MLARQIPTRAFRTSPALRQLPTLRQAPRCRYNSTKPNASSKPPTQESVYAAGALGGITAFAAMYAWYHMSGTAKAVKALKTVQEKMERAQKAAPSASDVMGYVRSLAESQLSMIPGVSMVFKELDELSSSHGDEVNKILGDTYDEIWVVVERGGDGTAQRVADILKKRGQQLKEVSKDAGDKLLNDFPQAKDTLGKAFEEVKSYADQYGPEAKKVADEAYDEIRKILQAGLSVESAQRAYKLITEKKEEVKRVGVQAAQKAWEKGQQEVGRNLDRYPQVKKILDENMGTLRSGGISATTVPMIFQKVKEMTSSGGDLSDDKVQQLKEYVQDIVKKGQQKMGKHGSSDSFKGIVEMAQSYLKQIPGGEKLMKDSPEVMVILEMEGKNPEQAERLVKETWEEVMNVLNKKIKEAKEIAKK